MDEDKNEAFAPLLHQVAGCHNGVLSKILINKRGQILKPYKLVSNPTFLEDFSNSLENKEKGVSDLTPVTKNELEFYKKLQKAQDTDSAMLRNLAPRFYGSTSIDGIDYLILEDLTAGMKYPCVADIKIGSNRNYPGKSKEKCEVDSMKYPSLKETGYCLAGMKLWNGEMGKVELNLTPKLTRNYSTEEVNEDIKRFLRVGNDELDNKPLLREIVAKMETIFTWSLSQSSYILMLSSLLVVYDAAGMIASEREYPLNTRVGVIDFAHVFHSGGQADQNYFKGIKHLLAFLKSLQ